MEPDADFEKEGNESEDVVGTVARIIGFPADQLSRASRLQDDLGLDFLDTEELIEELEHLYHVEVPARCDRSIRTIADIERTLAHFESDSRPPSESRRPRRSTGLRAAHEPEKRKEKNMRFQLSPLPYSKDALEPVISARTLDFHYGKHHRGYLSKLEKAIGGKPLAKKSLEEVVRESEGAVFNLAAQVWNHSFYWSCMSPTGGGSPSGQLAEAIERDFGGFRNFCRTFAGVANAHFGSGWAWLVSDREGGLRVISTPDAETPLRSKQVPLLTIDVWEHAYYLDYQNERDRYVSEFIERLIDWPFAEKNYQDVRSS